MEVAIKIKDYDIVVLPLKGKVFGRLRKDGTRKEIFTYRGKNGYHQGNGQDYPEALRSRLIWYAVSGPIPEGMVINHINHQRDDDKINNLELVTSQQNSWYRQKPKDNTSGFKGASYHKRTKKYQSQIRTTEGHIFLGLFTTAKEAALAYDEAARKYHGKYAVLNFPDTDKEVP